MNSVSSFSIDARIEIYSHGFCVSRLKPNIKNLVHQFCQGLLSYTSIYKPRRGYISVPNKVYAASNAGRTEFRFHIHQKQEFLDFLISYGIRLERLDIVLKEPPEGVNVDFTLADWIKPYDYQEEIIDYFTAPGHTKVTTLHTGGGKTICAMAAIAKMGKRTVVVVPGKYIYKWVGDLEGGLLLKKKELMVVRGAKHLQSLINLGLANEIEAKIIIVSSTTMQNYFKEFEKGDPEKYAVHPKDFYSTVGAGIRLIDEAHENLHLNFKQDVYANIGKALFLSATLEVDDKFINKILEIAYPTHYRFTPIPPDPYIDVEAINYKITDVERFRYEGRNKMYSHVQFEDSIIKSKRRLESYKAMVADIVKYKFLETYKDPLKMIIFASTVELCTILAKHLKELAPEHKVSRYVSEDPDEVLYENTIIVTTLQSAGTAVDIPNLEVGLLTVALGSKQLNRQALGRLRKIKAFPDLNPRYYYLNAENIPKHIEYHTRKMESFKGRVRSHLSVNSDFVI